MAAEIGHLPAGLRIRSGQECNPLAAGDQYSLLIELCIGGRSITAAFIAFRGPSGGMFTFQGAINPEAEVAPSVVILDWRNYRPRATPLAARDPPAALDLPGNGTPLQNAVLLRVQFGPYPIFHCGFPT